ncbi:MAG: polysaccharide deacetylase family protein, partial [Candidatus Helarchaeota archaeon]|nr:polysaccharide deacetylase family protein [Candidatus Helarchaeota archaeon]
MKLEKLVYLGSLILNELLSTTKKLTSLYVIKENPILPATKKIWFEGLAIEHKIRPTSKIEIFAFQTKNRLDIIKLRLGFTRNIAMSLRENEKGGKLFWIIKSLTVKAAEDKVSKGFFPFGIAVNFIRRIVCWLSDKEILCPSLVPGSNIMLLTGDIHSGTYPEWENRSVETVNRFMYGVTEPEIKLALRFIEILNRSQQKATFFVSTCIFDDIKNSVFLSKLTDENIELGIHGYNNEMLRKMHEADIRNLIRKCLMKLPSAIGYRAHGYRSDAKSRRILKDNNFKYLSDDHSPYSAFTHFDPLYVNPTNLSKNQGLFSFVISIDDSTRPSPLEFKRRMKFILKYWRDFSPIIITVVMHPVNTGGYYEKKYNNFALPLKD